MKIVLMILLGILFLNALVIFAIVGMLVLDQLKLRRKERHDKAANA